MKTTHPTPYLLTIHDFPGLKIVLSLFVVAFFAASSLASSDSESDTSDEKEAALAHWALYSVINENNILTTDLAHKNSEPRFEIVFFPLSFFVSGLEVGIEFPVRERQHLRLSAGYFYSYNAGAYNNFGSLSDNSFNYNYNEMEGFRTEAQYRFYWYTDGSHENFYVSPFAVFKSVNLSADRQAVNWGSTGPLPSQTVNLNSSALSLGVVFGARAILFDKMTFDVNLGGGITPTNMGDYELAHIEQINPYRRSIHFKGGLTVGILIY